MTCFGNAKRIDMALARVLKPGVGITSLSFGAFLGKLGFNQARHGPFLHTHGFLEQCAVFPSWHAVPSQGDRAHYTGSVPNHVLQ